MTNHHAVILAGGRGTRLRPYTVTLPKPLVPVADMPILEIIIRQLVATGFGSATIAVNHQAELIRAFFGDGSKWGIALTYSLGFQPLGTMGPLRLMRDLPANFLVMNGDVLTDLRFDALLDSHIEAHAMFTISASARTQSIDFGVLHVDGAKLIGFEEKPEIPYTVSMGVYAVSSEILSWIPENQAFGFDNLMMGLLAAKREVRVRVHEGIWLDIGRPDDYQDVCERWPGSRRTSCPMPADASEVGNAARPLPGTAPIISIVCPVFRRAETIEIFHATLNGALAPMRGRYQFMILYVVDPSSDETEARLARIAESSPDVAVLVMSRRFGIRRRLSQASSTATALPSSCWTATSSIRRSLSPSLRGAGREARRSCRRCDRRT